MYIIYTVSQKSGPPNWWRQLCRNLADFRNRRPVAQRVANFNFSIQQVVQQHTLGVAG